MSAKKHIVLIQFYEETPNSLSELKRRTSLLGKSLIKRGHKVTWIKCGFDHATLSYKNYDKVVYLHENFQIIHVNGIGYKKHVCFRRYLHDWISAIQMLSVLKKLESIDVIVSSIPSVLGSFFASRHARKNNIPLVLDLRDAWPDTYLYLTNNLFLRFILRTCIIPESILLRYSLKYSRAITAMSNDMLRWGFSKIKGFKKLSDVFYLSTTSDISIDKSTENEYAKKYKDLVSRSTFKCFYISRWGRVYQPNVILNVAEKMKKENVDFILCGDGEYGDVIRERSKSLNNVFLPGFVSPSEAYFLAKNCDCGVAFISNESQCHDEHIPSFPNKLFFQFMAGMPLINGMNGEIRNLIDKKTLGLNFFKNDPNEIAQCILKLRDNPQLRGKMGLNSRKFFEENGNPEVVYSNFSKFIENQLN